MVKIWMEAFWKPHPIDDWRPAGLHGQAPAVGVAVALAVMTLVLGCGRHRSSTWRRAPPTW